MWLDYVLKFLLFINIKVFIGEIIDVLDLF